MGFGFGDYVVYECDYGTNEIGRVVGETRDRRGYFVCYHDGCTAANTLKEMLRAANDDEIAMASKHIGYNRFADSCSKYNSDYCYESCRERFGK